MANFHPRGEWGGRTPTSGSIGQVDVVVIHHTASQNPPTEFDPQRWRNLENSEVVRGYSSLAYSFGIVNGPTGEIVESRGWGNKGAATGGYDWNSRSIAIVLDGYFHPPYNEQPTDAAIEAAADCIVNGVYLGYISRDFRCIPHSEASAGSQYSTACPGDNLRPRVSGFGSIEAIAKYKLEQSIPIAPTQPQPSPPSKPRCVGTCENRILKKGSSGVCVKTLQNLLNARGFNTNGVDGKFGQQTHDAVVCAQKSNGLTPDGIVGPKTWAALAG